ncbi:MAG: hypothetical protein KC535_01885, partial [Nanoarchaeota archaeon]|nr:hypothetical protein [Nanoarchaeota archaeon]
APLLMIALVSYFFIIIKHREKFSPGSFLSRFGDFGSNFYKGVMEHLRYKRAFLRVISGLLILHIITDMLTFLWNHLFGIGDPLYLALIGPHPSFLQLVRADLSLSWLTSFIHLGNLVAVIFLMATPLIMWFVLYFNKKIQVTNQTILFLFTCFLIFLLNPTFSFSALKNNIIYGVDITGVFASTYQLIPFAATLLIAIALSLIISNVSSRSIKTILVVAGKVFFVLYVSLYFFSISMYYVKIIPQLLSSLPFTGFIFGIFFLITALFYLVGLGSFLVDTHEHLQEHLSVKA